MERMRTLPRTPRPPRPAPRRDLRELAAIFAGGFVGAIARAELAQLAPKDAGAWPWTTFTVNLVGTFLLGWFVTRLQERLPPSAYRRPLLGTGFCGTLTTFSTMQVEVLRMFDGGHLWLAAGYISASIVGGLLAIRAAFALGRGVRVIA